MKDPHYAKRAQRRNFFWSEYGPENATYLDTFRAVACRANQKNPAKSLFKKVFNKKKFRSISTDWGYMHTSMRPELPMLMLFLIKHQHFSIKISRSYNSLMLAIHRNLSKMFIFT